MHNFTIKIKSSRQELVEHTDGSVCGESISFPANCRLQCRTLEITNFKAAAEAVYYGVVLLRHCPEEAQCTHIYSVLMGAFFSDCMGVARCLYPPLSIL